ncbi:MAG TPA: crosslink repair DNA glycosylase YcaQ family protein [Candidatus Limnocylindrales bacterium]|nr:crosslink repair DNA glycosylase YcaQ family protein [Candidatus Limnocylindrales bacterium]
MPVRVTWPQALAWRLERQLLAPVGRLPVEGVVRRRGGVQAQVASSAELAVRVRRATSRAGEVDRALAAGKLIKTWAMRGSLHLLTPDDGAAFLALVADAQPWRKRAWDAYFHMDADRWVAYREAARDALANRTLTREELIEAITARPGLDHVGEGLRSSWGTMLKPLAWQGDLCYGPSRGNRVTYRRPEDASPAWSGLPPIEVAAPKAIATYVGAYGPATVDAFRRWLGAGSARIRRLVKEHGGRLVEVDVDGEPAFVLDDHVEALAAARPTSAVRLVPGFDAYVLGPGSTDGHVIPRGRRSAVSRQAGWISPVVVAGGVVAGTWLLDGDVVEVTWFGEAGRPPRTALGEEVERLATIVGRELATAVAVS